MQECRIQHLACLSSVWMRLNFAMELNLKNGKHIYLSHQCKIFTCHFWDLSDDSWITKSGQKTHPEISSPLPGCKLRNVNLLLKMFQLIGRFFYKVKTIIYFFSILRSLHSLRFNGILRWRNTVKSWFVFIAYKFLARNEPPHFKTNRMTVRPAKTQISLVFRPVWSESSLCGQRIAVGPSFLHADSEDSDQTGRMPRLIWVFAGHTCHFVGFVMRRLKSLLSVKL